MGMALAAQRPSVAMLHLELARLHREKRDALAVEAREKLRDRPSRIFNGTDKEG